MEQLSLKYN